MKIPCWVLQPVNKLVRKSSNKQRIPKAHQLFGKILFALDAMLRGIMHHSADTDLGLKTTSTTAERQQRVVGFVEDHTLHESATIDKEVLKNTSTAKEENHRIAIAEEMTEVNDVQTLIRRTVNAIKFTMPAAPTAMIRAQIKDNKSSTKTQTNKTSPALSQC
jgi:hypothetical protein